MTSRFRFRLQSVLDERLRREELLERDLAQALAALAAQQERAVDAESRERDAVRTLREAMGDTLELARLRGLHNAVVLARRRVGHEHEGVEQLERIALERRAELVRARQDREALAKLKVRQEDEHRRAEQAAEAAELDELGLRRAARARARQGAAA